MKKIIKYLLNKNFNFNQLFFSSFLLVFFIKEIKCLKKKTRFDIGERRRKERKIKTKIFKTKIL
jgi:hypothetical protein